ncbi:MAG TPA: hypothetical protein VMD05_03260 [Candidatus Nanoarchaeia archaeon]|nr:hypothetical protein [Candidatus Nanoarchaeia archaeon]
MRSSIIILLTLIASIILIGGTTNFASAATGQPSGYVQYKIAVNDPSKPYMQTSATVNYSVAPTSQAGFVDITLALSSTQTNFTYSKALNASSLPEIYPYLPGLTNQSFSYQTQGIFLTANLVNQGQVAVTFNGTSYQATKYQISVTAQNSSSQQSFGATGTVTSMPSGLISDAQLTLNQTTTITVTLVSTNLSLNAPPTSINTVGASLFGGAIIAVAAIAAFAAYRNQKAKKSAAKTQMAGAENSQPSYGVD